MGYEAGWRVFKSFIFKYRILQIMKKQQMVIFILSGIFICVIAVGYGATKYVTLRERMQIELAKHLGVRIEDYPFRSSFPSGYFYTILEPGMTIAEVQNIVQGYEKVLHCGNRSEIYYYFSSELVDAIRFKLRYDDQGNYWDFEGEEDDSRTLQTNGCKPGTITK
jgi:hypothetical protein